MADQRRRDNNMTGIEIYTKSVKRGNWSISATRQRKAETKRKKKAGNGKDREEKLSEEVSPLKKGENRS